MTKPIRIALVGLGKIARDQHVPAIRGDARFVLAATADARGGIDDVPAFDSLDALLADGPAIDAVAICTPPQVRGALARAAIDVGKHVLLEKPPAATLTELAALRALADTAGVTLFAAWHSRFAPMVGPAKTWLDGRVVSGGRITWREDVRRWHPGQAWLWAPGGLGVFDPGINAFSILTALLPGAVLARAATLDVPANTHTPIAARLTLAAGAASIAVDLDFRQEGEQTWELALDTADGRRLLLSAGGATMTIGDGAPERADPHEYPGVYARFATLIGAGESDADDRPLAIVADALLIAEKQRVDAFHDPAPDA